MVQSSLYLTLTLPRAYSVQPKNDVRHPSPLALRPCRSLLNRSLLTGESRQLAHTLSCPAALPRRLSLCMVCLYDLVHPTYSMATSAFNTSSVSHTSVDAYSERSSAYNVSPATQTTHHKPTPIQWTLHVAIVSAYSCPLLSVKSIFFVVHLFCKAVTGSRLVLQSGGRGGSSSEVQEPPTSL